MRSIPRGRYRCLKNPGVLMNTAMPTTGNLYLVVRYDGSLPPSGR